MKIIILTILSVFITTGCTTTVDLTVKNLDSIPMNVAVDIINKAGVKTETISVGNIAAGGNGNYSFDVKNGGSFAVSGSIHSGVEVYTGTYITVTGDQDPFKKEVVIKSNCREYPGDKAVLEILSKSFKNLGSDIGAVPLGLKDALESMIGALVVANNESGKNKILYTVTPGVFGVYVMKLDDITFPQTNETEQMVMSGSASIQASGSFGPIAKFGINWDQRKVYELKWVLRGFGQITKKENPLKDPVSMFNKLSDDHKNQLHNVLQNNPGAKIYYINRAYVINRAEIFIKEAKELLEGGNVDETSIIKGSTAYTFKNSTETTKGYGPVVLNYWGEEYTMVEIPKNESSSIDIHSNKNTKNHSNGNIKTNSNRIVKTHSNMNTKFLPSETSGKDDKNIYFLVPTGHSVQFSVKRD